jgi:hypothetical protein
VVCGGFGIKIIAMVLSDTERMKNAPKYACKDE